MSRLLIALVVGQLGSASPLAEAERAASNGRFDLVLTEVDRALARSLRDAERRRAWELKAIAASAFDDSRQAIDAFRHLIGVDPQATAEADWSPKLLGLFARAKELGPLPAAPASLSALPEPTPAVSRPPTLLPKLGLGLVTGGAFTLALGVGFASVSRSNNAPPLASLSGPQALALESQRTHDAALANAMWVTSAVLVTSGIAALWGAHR